MFDLVEIGLQCIVLRYWIICTVSGSTDWDDDEEAEFEATPTVGFVDRRFWFVDVGVKSLDLDAGWEAS